MFDYYNAIRSKREFGLKHMILALIYQQTMTGSMLIDKMDHLSMGFWRPSPGSVYPLLKKLVSDGDLEIKVKEDKKYYTITEKGKETINNSWFPWKTLMKRENKGSVENTIEEMEGEAEYISEKLDYINKKPELKKRLNRIIQKLNK
ncbi:PadR family transcriptional regulator [Candidatus Parvarchaeota archaeon]|nr:PadR family transcriptional regulator [Candidatus Parvarchaeota archaeon]